MHKKLIHTFSFPYNKLIVLVILFTSNFISLPLFVANAAQSNCSLSFTLTPVASSQSDSTITRTVTLKNIGSTPCKEVSYSLYYPPNERFVSSTQNSRAGNYYWYIGTMPGGNQIVSTLVTKFSPITPSEMNLEGCATANGASDACADSQAPVANWSTTPSSNSVVTPTPVTSPVSVTPVPVTQPAVQTPMSTSTSVTNSTSVSSQKEQGIWVWDFASQMNSSTGDSQLQQLHANRFNVIYLTIDDYIDIASMPSGSAKTTASNAYFATLAKVVTKANSLGMQVDAEGGWRDWAIPANQWKGFALIDAVKQYNALYPNAKLRGFQYDVEPYLLSNYETDKSTVLTQYVGFIDQSVARLVGSNIQFSIVIPHFYDSVQNWTPAITYSGTTAYTFTQLLSVLQKKPGSEILLMSYRDTFAGANGTQGISEAEIQEASSGKYATKVIVAQETGNVDPSYVTYYGATKAVLFSALSTIGNYFSKYSNYGGTAVHYMDSFLVMK